MDDERIPGSGRRDPFPDWKPTRKWKGPDFAMRRAFFRQHPEHCNSHVVCPACAYPILRENRSYEHCSLCHWNDDGQDDPYAGEDWAGPNDSSLNKARENFEVTCSVWSFEEIDDFSPWNQSQIFDLRVIECKHRLRAAYDRLMTLNIVEEIAAQWWEIEGLWRQKGDLYKSIEEEVRTKLESRFGQR